MHFFSPFSYNDWNELVSDVSDVVKLIIFPPGMCCINKLLHYDSDEESSENGKSEVATHGEGSEREQKG